MQGGGIIVLVQLTGPAEHPDNLFQHGCAEFHAPAVFQRDSPRFGKRQRILPRKLQPAFLRFFIEREQAVGCFGIV